MSLDRLTAALADRYHLERELGAGGMATVYLAHDLKHDRKVALKVLKPELSAILGAQRFLHEIKTTANLQHPHIVPLHDSGEAGGQVYYVMPYIEGESLRDRLVREKQLPIEDAVRVAREVADALDYAHQHGVVHRDIKPENILLHGGHAQVADFGIALAASQSTGGNRMTETGMSLGTPQYMSPEQAMGEREITGRSDVYALACVTYEMLCGEPPFAGPTAQAIMAKLLTEEPRPLLPKRHTIPSYVEAAVLKALEKIPADRFATAAEFSKALGDRAFATVASRSAVSAARPPIRRSALLVTAAALVIAITAFVAGAWLWHPSVPPITGFGRATKVTWDPGLEFSPALSPDGKYVAYAAGNAFSTRIFVRQVTGGRPIPLTTGQDETQSEPGWSADGSRVLY
ncbi:MAG TPA: protein kinase, partial [Gemmatimonadales bacterium]|nr:protein kinase [Gemmatimonadales bacterium]